MATATSETMAVLVNDRKLSRPETAFYIGCSKRLVDQLTSEGKLRAIKVGRRTLYDRADVDAFLESCKTATAPAAV
jgi:excisionase family DNA binding protein